MVPALLLIQSFVFPSGVLIAPDGDILVADRGAHRVFRIDAAGTVRTIIGNGTAGFAGDGGTANAAGITNPFGLLFAADGTLLIFDTESHTIRAVDLSTGMIRTVIGTGEKGFSGDGGPATRAMLYRPHNGVLDAQGNLVFGDSFNQRIRRWDPRTGIITTIAGTGEQGSSPAGTTAGSAKFTFFGAMVYDRAGRLLFTSLDHRILAIDQSGVLQVVAGTGTEGFAGDGGPAIAAQLNTPYGLAITPSGDLIFADAGNRRIRRIDTHTGIIRTIQ